MADEWREYQEEAAEFFRSLGLTAVTNVTLKGVRTTHNIDVYVTIDMAGFQVRWLVECKHWRSSVTKLHVLALREIVADLGADRGIILCEEGFQSGAVEAANLTNVQVSSLAALAALSKDAIYAARLRELYDRTELSRERYWNILKTFVSKRDYVSTLAMHLCILVRVSLSFQVEYLLELFEKLTQFKLIRSKEHSMPRYPNR